MKSIRLYFDYFKNTVFVWVLLLVCIYIALACEFESLRLSVFSINKDLSYVDKVNTILENLSFSYIAGVIFFFLSDTIPFLRRKKIAYRHVEKSLRLIIESIDSFSTLINGNIWDANTDSKVVFEEYTGRVYTNDMPMYELQANLLAIFKKMSEELSIQFDFVISQELYIEKQLLCDIERIKTNESFILLKALSNQKHIPSIKLVELFNLLIEIKMTINKYLL